MSDGESTAAAEPSRKVLTQNPKYKNPPSLLRHYENRANYYRQKHPWFFFVPTLGFGTYALFRPLKHFLRHGTSFTYMNLLVFGLFWDWVCFSRIFFENTKGIRKWFLPNDFYEFVPKDQVEEWKDKKLQEWKEELRQRKAASAHNQGEEQL
mmetsp:Transcript_7840/g.29337  ORF Transcript_7840/g.29337 Transcript_7840/m.29337 type:complete len:152 (-) Transcript_7840:4477-4932(-)